MLMPTSQEQETNQFVSAWSCLCSSFLPSPKNKETIEGLYLSLCVSVDGTTHEEYS